VKADGSVRHVQARVQRQVVGDGAFPLAELLAAVPPATPISIEVPHAGLQAQLSAVEFAALNLRAVRALLTREGPVSEHITDDGNRERRSTCSSSAPGAGPASPARPRACRPSCWRRPSSSAAPPLTWITWIATCDWFAGCRRYVQHQG
jgi:hypothetical protein